MKRWLSGSFWLTAGILTVALLTALDSYRRPYIERPYGPYLRQYYTDSLAMARRLEATGSYALEPEDRWHLLRGWEEELSGAAPPRALARARRAQIIVPVARPRPLEVRLDVRGLPASGREPERLVVEYGVDGVAAGRFQVPPGTSAMLSFEIPEAALYRGDNVVFLYRVTRRADPSPWLSLGRLEVEALDGEGRGGS